MTEIEQKRFYELLGQKIRDARTRAGLKQESFATFLQLSRASIVNIEKGRQHPPIHLLWVIASTLKIDVTELLPPMESYAVISPKLQDILIQQRNNGRSTTDENKIMEFIKSIQSS